MFKKIAVSALLGLLGLILFNYPVKADIVVVGASAGGSSIGTAVTGGTATRVLFVDGSGNLAGDADLTFSTDTLSATKIVSTGLVVFGSAADAVNAISFNATAGRITWEGAAADTSEHELTATVNAGFDTVTTIPATGASQTIMVLENAQTVTGNKTYSGTIVFSSTVRLTTQAGFLEIGTSNSGGLWLATAPTPDSVTLWPGPDSNAISIVEDEDSNSDEGNGPCGTAVCTAPHLIIHSSTVNTTNYSGMAYYGSAGKAIKSLTAGAATDVVRIPVASGAGTGGVLTYTVFATDTTDHQTRTGTIHFSVVNKAGTETCKVFGVDSVLGVAGTENPNQTQDASGIGAISSGTLTYTWGVDVTPTNGCDLQLNAASSLTETVLDIYYRVDLVGPGEPLPQ